METILPKDCRFSFEACRPAEKKNLSYKFINPFRVITLEGPGKLQSFFLELETLSRSYYLAGFFSYEFGYLLEPKFENYLKTSFPYAVFCAYKKVEISRADSGCLEAGRDDYRIKDMKLNKGKAGYKSDVAKIKKLIAAGDIYQANYTIKYKFNFSGSAEGLYRDMKYSQGAGYNAFAKFGRYSILSASPELFFRKTGREIEVKPMKGTIARGKDICEDSKLSETLQKSPKDRSENVMIVDVLRNDLGRVSETGSVKTVKLFEVEKYNTLFQMTSTVRSRLKKGLRLFGLIQALYPSASVTGAPKIHAMEIIKGLEKEERKIYTGAVGFFAPGSDALFNVAIRTVLIENNKGEMGVGSGIVADSSPEKEYEETKLKGNFLTMQKNEFVLRETLLFNKKLNNLKTHFERLGASARYFNFPFDKKAISKKLLGYCKKLAPGRHRVWLRLDKNGLMSLDSAKIQDAEFFQKKLFLAVSKKRTSSLDRFLFHKTSNRELYDAELKTARKKGYFDVIFMNEKGEITEGARGNIYIEKSGCIFTPPASCGLLNGTVRRNLIRKGAVKEKILRLRDLESAEKIYISNAVFGLREAFLH